MHKKSQGTMGFRSGAGTLFPDFFFTSISLQPVYPVLLPRCRTRYITVDISDCTVTDTFPFSFYAEFFQYEFVLRQPEFLFSSVDPDTAKTKRMRSEQHIPDHKAAVIEIRRMVFVSENDQDHRRTVKRICSLFHARDQTV